MILLLILILAIVILLLLIYLIFNTKSNCPDIQHIKNILQKSNNFIQDICEQIDESERYVVLPADENVVENCNMYINFSGKSDIEVYEIIIRLLSRDIAKKKDVKDVETTYKRIEQVAYMQGYLSRTL